MRARLTLLALGYRHHQGTAGGISLKGEGTHFCPRYQRRADWSLRLYGRQHCFPQVLLLAYADGNFYGDA